MPAKNTLSQPFAGNTANFWPNKETLSAPISYGKTRVASHTVSNPSFAFGNYSGTQTTEDLTLPTITIEASLEYPIGSTPVRLKFNGSNQATLAATDFWETDPASGVTITAGDHYRINTCVVSSTGTGWPVDNGENLYDVTGCDSVTGNAVTTGNYVAADGAVTGRGLFPLTIHGTTDGGHPHDSYSLIGDSIGAFGYINDGLTPKNVVWVRWCIAGMGGASFTAADQPIKTAFSRHADHVVSQYGVNDARGGGSTASSVRAVMDAIAAIFVGNDFIQTTLTPLSTSTDNWASTGNQTSFGHIDTINANLIATPTSGVTVWDAGNAVMSSAGSNKWKSNGSANTYTPDGIHPTQPLAQSLLAAAIAAITLPLSAATTTTCTVSASAALVVGTVATITLEAAAGKVFDGTQSVAVTISPEGTTLTVTPTRDSGLATFSFTPASIGLHTISGVGTNVTSPADLLLGCVGSAWKGAVLSLGPALYARNSVASGTSVPDISGNGLDGTISGTPQYQQPGGSNDGDTALGFSGGGFETFPAPAGMIGAFSWGILLKTTATNQRLGGRDDSSVNRDWIVQVGTAGILQAVSLAGGETVSGSLPIADGNYHLLGVTASLSGGTYTWTGWVDGVADGTDNRGSSTTPHTCPNLFYNGFFSSGQTIDEPFAFNYALTSAQWALLNRARLAVLSADVVSLDVGTTGNTVTLHDPAATWLTTSPTFTMAGGTGASIASQTIVDNTHATVTVSAGSASGVQLTITDPASFASVGLSVTVPVTPSLSPTATAGALTITLNSGLTGGVNPVVTCTCIAKPAGAADPSIDDIHSTTPTATISKLGAYTFQFDVIDDNLDTDSKTCLATVVQVHTSTTISGPAYLVVGDTKTYVGYGFDQFLGVMIVAPTFAYSFTAGSSTIDSSTGTATANATPETATVQATANGHAGSRTVHVVIALPPSSGGLRHLKQLPQLKQISQL